jgi:hypothetical protein
MLLETVSVGASPFLVLRCLPVMKPEDGVESRDFNYAHVAQSEDVVKAVVKCLKITDGSTVCFVAD